ncbi:MAG: hypothetical protein IKB25_00100 [Lentisphaeria bacterium]|nr:hypothetical protein [Lentisphaeria bacterium]
MGRYAGELLYRICTGMISREAAVEEARNHQIPVQIKEWESTGSPVLSR